MLRANSRLVIPICLFQICDLFLTPLNSDHGNFEGFNAKRKMMMMAPLADESCCTDNLNKALSHGFVAHSPEAMTGRDYHNSWVLAVATYCRFMSRALIICFFSGGLSLDCCH